MSLQPITPNGILSQVQFELTGPIMDASQFRTRLSNNVLEEVVGADGRFIGAVRSFPGFTRITSLSIDSYGTAPEGINFLYCFTVPIAGTEYQHRGYVFRCYNPNNPSRGILVANSYNSASKSWSVVRLSESVPYDGSIDACTYRDAVLVATGENGILWQPNTNTISDLYNYVWETAPLAPLELPDLHSTTGGYLSRGRYQVAFRIVSPHDATVQDSTPLGESLTLSIDSFDVINGLLAVRANPSESYNSSLAGCTVEVFRTISIYLAESIYAGGVFYKESELPYEDWINGSVVLVGVLPDEVLVQQTRYDPTYDDTIQPPQGATAISVFQGVAFANTAARNVLRWSTTRESAIRKFHPDQEYILPDNSGNILRIKDADDAIYILAERSIYRATLAGGRLHLQKLHSNYGLSAPLAVTQVGQDLILMTQAGLCILNGNTGELSEIGAVSRLVHERKWTSATALRAASDSLLGASFFIGGDYPHFANNMSDTARGCLVVWHKAGLATMMLDMDMFTAVAEGPNPLVGGASRAHFCTHDGIVVIPSLSYSDGAPTILGVSGTLNGSVSVSTTTTTTTPTTTTTTSSSTTTTTTTTSTATTTSTTSTTSTTTTTTTTTTPCLGTYLNVTIAGVGGDFSPWNGTWVVPRTQSDDFKLSTSFGVLRVWYSGTVWYAMFYMTNTWCSMQFRGGSDPCQPGSPSSYSYQSCSASGCNNPASCVLSSSASLYVEEKYGTVPTTTSSTSSTSSTATTTPASYIVLSDSSASFSSTAVGARLYAFKPDGTITAFNIVGRPSTTVLYLQRCDNPLGSYTFENGERYTISPIPFRLTLPPIGGDFGRQIVTAIGLSAAFAKQTAGSGDTVNLLARAFAATGSSVSTPYGDVGLEGSAWGNIKLGELPEYSYAAVPMAGPRITAGILIVCAGSLFELTSLRIQGKITAGQTTASPAVT